jgi:signal peptidase II
MTWIIVLSAVIADRVSKVLCQKYLQPLGTVPIIKGVFHFTYVENTGAAFGILQDKNWLFIPAVILISVAIVYLIWTLKQGSKLIKAALALILGGALGNLIDRVFLGYVVDFLDFRVWPVFNIADSCVVVGAVLLGYLVVIKGEGLQ